MSTRRDFLLSLGAGAAALGIGCNRASMAASGRKSKPRAGQIKLPAGGSMSMRPLGKTGISVSLLGIGGYHLGHPDERTATRIVHAALDHGATFFDNCWDYHDGRSEERLGAALAQDGLRQKAFVMTKIDGRTRAAAAAQIDQSLKRLRTDVVDLMQVHEVIRMNDADRVFAAGGAMEAIQAARKAGKIRFVGFTGHKDPTIHLHMLEVARQHAFHFDAVQLPLNVMDPHFRSFQEQVLPELQRDGIGVLGMKSIGDGLILESGVASAEECLRYTMSLPASVVITGCDTIGVLEQALAVALAFRPLDDGQRRALLTRTAAAGAKGRWERFKISADFDGTAHNPAWLG